ncbi:hypothetical protein SNEBB_008041 [Seison nebaliae]|nr:hypothetical protein SNEBB_008041 [Seison nebaliae]
MANAFEFTPSAYMVPIDFLVSSIPDIPDDYIDNHIESDIQIKSTIIKNRKFDSCYNRSLRFRYIPQQFLTKPSAEDHLIKYLNRTLKKQELLLDLNNNITNNNNNLSKKKPIFIEKLENDLEGKKFEGRKSRSSSSTVGRVSRSDTMSNNDGSIDENILKEAAETLKSYEKSKTRNSFRFGAHAKNRISIKITPQIGVQCYLNKSKNEKFDNEETNKSMNIDDNQTNHLSTVDNDVMNTSMDYVMMSGGDDEDKLKEEERKTDDGMTLNLSYEDVVKEMPYMSLSGFRIKSENIFSNKHFEISNECTLLLERLKVELEYFEKTIIGNIDEKRIATLSEILQQLNNDEYVCEKKQNELTLEWTKIERDSFDQTLKMLLKKVDGVNGEIIALLSLLSLYPFSTKSTEIVNKVVKILSSFDMEIDLMKSSNLENLMKIFELIIQLLLSVPSISLEEMTETYFSSFLLQFIINRHDYGNHSIFRLKMASVHIYLLLCRRRLISIKSYDQCQRLMEENELTKDLLTELLLEQSLILKKWKNNILKLIIQNYSIDKQLRKNIRFQFNSKNNVSLPIILLIELHQLLPNISVDENLPDELKKLLRIFLQQHSVNYCIEILDTCLPISFSLSNCFHNNNEETDDNMIQFRKKEINLTNGNYRHEFQLKNDSQRMEFLKDFFTDVHELSKRIEYPLTSEMLVYSGSIMLKAFQRRYINNSINLVDNDKKNEDIRYFLEFIQLLLPIFLNYSYDVNEQKEKYISNHHLYSTSLAINSSDEGELAYQIIIDYLENNKNDLKSFILFDLNQNVNIRNIYKLISRNKENEINEEYSTIQQNCSSVNELYYLFVHHHMGQSVFNLMIQMVSGILTFLPTISNYHQTKLLKLLVLIFSQENASTFMDVEMVSKTIENSLSSPSICVREATLNIIGEQMKHTEFNIDNCEYLIQNLNDPSVIIKRRIFSIFKELFEKLGESNPNVDLTLMKKQSKISAHILEQLKNENQSFHPSILQIMRSFFNINNDDHSKNRIFTISLVFNSLDDLLPFNELRRILMMILDKNLIFNENLIHKLIMEHLSPKFIKECLSKNDEDGEILVEMLNGCMIIIHLMTLINIPSVINYNPKLIWLLHTVSHDVQPKYFVSIRHTLLALHQLIPHLRNGQLSNDSVKNIEECCYNILKSTHKQCRDIAAALLFQTTIYLSRNFDKSIQVILKMYLRIENITKHFESLRQKMLEDNGDNTDFIIEENKKDFVELNNLPNDQSNILCGILQVLGYLLHHLPYDKYITYVSKLDGVTSKDKLKENIVKPEKHYILLLTILNRTVGTFPTYLAALETFGYLTAANPKLLMRKETIILYKRMFNNIIRSPSTTLPNNSIKMCAQVLSNLTLFLTDVEQRKELAEYQEELDETNSLSNEQSANDITNSSIIIQLYSSFIGNVYMRSSDEVLRRQCCNFLEKSFKTNLLDKSSTISLICSLTIDPAQSINELGRKLFQKVLLSIEQNKNSNNIFLQQMRYVPIYSYCLRKLSDDVDVIDSNYLTEFYELIQNKSNFFNTFFNEILELFLIDFHQSNENGLNNIPRLFHSMKNDLEINIHIFYSHLIHQLCNLSFKSMNELMAFKKRLEDYSISVYSQIVNDLNDVLQPHVIEQDSGSDNDQFVITNEQISNPDENKMILRLPNDLKDLLPSFINIRRLSLIITFRLYLLKYYRLSSINEFNQHRIIEKKKSSKNEEKINLDLLNNYFNSFLKTDETIGEIDHFVGKNVEENLIQTNFHLNNHSDELRKQIANFLTEFYFIDIIECVPFSKNMTTDTNKNELSLIRLLWKCIDEEMPAYQEKDDEISKFTKPKMKSPKKTNLTKSNTSKTGGTKTKTFVLKSEGKTKGTTSRVAKGRIRTPVKQKRKTAKNEPVSSARKSKRARRKLIDFDEDDDDDDDNIDDLLLDDTYNSKDEESDPDYEYE